MKKGKFSPGKKFWLYGMEKPPKVYSILHGYNLNFRPILNHTDSVNSVNVCIKYCCTVSVNVH